MTGSSIVSMGEPSNLSSIQPAEDDIRPGLRVRSDDYGKGTVVAVFGALGIQVHWDEEILGTREHTLMHDRSYINRLERI